MTDPHPPDEEPGAAGCRRARGGWAVTRIPRAPAPFHLGESFAMAGEIDHAMDLIEQAVDGGFCPYRFINEYRPFLEPLRGTPRFAAIAAKAKQRGEAFR